MFSTPRRPVPSTAALRILRQLAYISSGTACGAAALIAEERRRQTHVAKKIVDNTRRLKQHPRYAGPGTARKSDYSFFAAEANVSGDEERNGPFFLNEMHNVDGTAREGLRYDAGSSLIADVRPDDHRHSHLESDAFRDGVLPSEVDKGYRKYVKRQSHPQLAHLDDHASHATSRQSHPRPPVAARGETLSIPNTARGASAVEQSRVRDQPSSEAHEVHRPTFPFFKHDLEDWSPPPNIKNQHSAFAQPNPTSFRDLDQPHLLAAEKVEQMASTFAKINPTTGDGNPSLESVLLASRLLDASIQTCSLNALKEISAWLLLTCRMEVHHLEKICLGIPHLLLQNDTKVVCAFCLDLFTSKSVGKTRDVDTYRLLAIAGLLDTDPGFDTVRKLIVLVKRQTTIDHTEILFRCCRMLLDEGRQRDAFRLLETCHHYKLMCSALSTTQTAVAEELVEYLVGIDNLQGSAMVLKYIDQAAPKFEAILHRLVLECKERREYKILARLHQDYGQRHRFPDESYLDVCAACAAYGTKAISPQYSSILESQTDNSALIACQSAWPALIERKWKDTRNFDAVKEYFSRMRSLTANANVDTATSNAMILVCVRAGQNSEAESLLRQMQEDTDMNPDLTTFRNFVFSAARAQDWDSVRSMLKSLGNASVVHDASADYTRWFIPVLKEYVLRHNPTQVWSFVSTALEECGIVPTHEMNDIVLESFVGGMRLDLVHPWLAYTQTFGLQAKLGASATLRMFRRYYRKSRPGHIVMMNLYRNLKHSAPEVCSRGFNLLVQESIGYDLRHAKTDSNAVRLKESALRRLELVRHGEDYQPSKLAPEEDTRIHSRDADSGYAPKSDHAAAQTENDILLSLSLGQPMEALAFYRRAVQASGLPHSSVSLETAINASLRAQRGDPMEAEELLGEAQNADFDISPALMPLMIARLKRLDKRTEDLKLEELANTVIKFYKTMDTKNVPVRHHVATTAAHVLIKHGKPQEGISLLRIVYESPWTKSAAGKPFDTAAMTVFMQGYVKMGHKAGIEWVVRTILENDLRIDTAFLKVMRRARTHFRLAATATEIPQYTELSESVEELRRVCKERQMEQIKQASRLGNRLAICISQAHRLERPVNISSKEWLETDLHGAKWTDEQRVRMMTRKSDNGNRDLSEQQLDDGLDPVKRYFEQQHRRIEQPQSCMPTVEGSIPYKEAWRRASVPYRDFLRRGLQDEEGKRLKFRYVNVTPLR